MRRPSHGFDNINSKAQFWRIEQIDYIYWPDAPLGGTFYVDYDHSVLYPNTSNFPDTGQSVRCIQDTE